MRLCVRLLRFRGENILCVFWHSTEIVAGCSPQVPDKAAEDHVFERIFSFFTWLKSHFNVRGTTMTGLFDQVWKKEQGKPNGGYGTTFPDKAELGPVTGDW